MKLPLLLIFTHLLRSLIQVLCRLRRQCLQAVYTCTVQCMCLDQDDNSMTSMFTCLILLVNLHVHVYYMHILLVKDYSPQKRVKEVVM